MRIPLKCGHAELSERILTRGEDTLRLTPNEARLLAYLAERPGQTVSQSELLREVFGYAQSVRSRTAVTTMQRLRAKVELDPANPTHLHTLYGEGYRFDPLGAHRGLLGRSGDLQTLRALLDQGPCWLVAPGGFGKSALARELAHPLAEQALWVDLSDRSTSEELLAAIASALDIEQLAHLESADLALQSRGLRLVVLDGAEELQAVVEAWVARWCAPVSVLITSRLPPQDQPTHLLAPLSPPQAAALFEQRAPGTLEAPGVRELVERLGGIPLALELAADHLAAFSPQDLGPILADLSAMLSGGEGRHASMQSVLRWSWERTPLPHRQALEPLALSPSGLRLSEAAQLAGPGGLSTLKHLQQLGWLTERQGRLLLLDPLRHFVQERADLSRAASEHRALFLRLARERQEGFQAGRESAFLSREWANLRVAIQGGLRAEDPRAADLVLLLAVPLIRRRSTARAMEWLDAAIGLAQGRVQAELLLERANLWLVRASLTAAERDIDRASQLGEAPPGEVAYRRGKLLRHQGDPAAAVPILEGALSGLQGARRLNAQTELAYCLIRSGRASEATPMLQETLARARLQDAPGPAFLALGTLASLHLSQERYEEAERAYRAALQICERIGDRANAAALHHNLGNLFFYTGDAAQAEQQWRAALSLTQHLGSRQGAALSKTNLAQLAIHQRQLERAAALLTEARHTLSEVGLRPGAAFATFNLGRIEALEGRWAPALAAFDKAEPELPAFAHWWLAAERAIVFASMGRPEAAEQVLSGAVGQDASSRAGLELARGFCLLADPESNGTRGQVQAILRQVAPIQELPIVDLARRLRARL